MLEIDYSLVPMTVADQKMVRDEVARRVEQGEIPPPDRAVNGRVILLNPDPVQTIHQVSDDLRPRLRRIMMPAQEGSSHLSAQKLRQAIVDSDERLYLVIIELQSEFRSLNKFLEYLPDLRRDFPELGVFLSGTLQHLREKFHQVLSEGQAILVLEYPDDRGVVEIRKPEEFIERVSTQEQVVSLSTPFFSEIRLKLDASGRAVPLNLISLRKLHAVLGYGEAQEVEVGKGRRERMIIVELPLEIIQDFRFRQDRGLDFLGVVIGGQDIPSRHFGEEKLEFRWVPMKAVEGFLRRNAMGEEERVDLKNVASLRVNTLTGQVSFIMKIQAERVALEQASRIGFRMNISGKANDGQAPEFEDGTTLIAFDQVIQPSTTSAQRDPMQEAVRQHFYGRLIGDDVEQNRKIEIYAQRLRVASVGPLAGQTLKLLRRFGMERVIEENSFHYLCDTPEDIPHYQETPERYQDHFQGLVNLIRQMAFGEPSENIRIGDIAYNLPISTEWVDTGLASYDKVTNQELEAVYHEMQMLLNFITHEFRRNFELSEKDVSFFEKMEQCRQAGLLAKWLSEFKRGAYGNPLPEKAQPDVLVFATEEEKKENDTKYFFPSISCMELFRDEVNKSLFLEFDYDFSVFLEEQLALAVHHARQEGVLQPTTKEFSAYFQMKIGEATQETDELREAVEAIDDADSPVYQNLLRQEEETYHQRSREFQNDLEKVENNLASTTTRLEDMVEELRGDLELGGMDEASFLAEDPDHPEAKEKRVLDAAGRTETHHREHMIERFAKLSEIIDGWLKRLDEFTGILRRFHQFHHAWQTAEDHVHLAEVERKWEIKLQERHGAVRKMKLLEREHHGKRVETQLLSQKTEMGQIDDRLNQHNQKNQRSLAMLKHYMAHASSRMTSLRQSDTAEESDKVVAQADTLRKTLVEISKNAHTLAGRSLELQQNLDQIRLRKRRQLEHFYQLQVEVSILKALANDSEPTLPASQRKGGSTGEDELERLKNAYATQKENLKKSRVLLVHSVKEVEEALVAVKGQAANYSRFRERREALIRVTYRKQRLRESFHGLTERQSMMEDELANLPQMVKQLFMPARKKLLVDVFIPESERRIAMFGKVEAFLGELLNLSYDRVRERYLDHTIYRRFYSHQFRRGGAYAPDSASPLHHTMHNAQPALRFLLRAFQHNYKRLEIRGAERLTLPQLTYQAPREILASLENMAQSEGYRQFDYLVLPSTLPFMDGLNLINRKDLLFKGIPSLVIVFITKFDIPLLRRDDTVRDAYFKAIRHNVVINVDGHVVVDNPRAIGMRLLQETLGCAIDIPSVEEPPEVASAAID